MYLADFRNLVRDRMFVADPDEHPVFYYESGEDVYFYKPHKGVMYYTHANIMLLPEEITIEDLKDELKAIEIPERPDAPRQILGTLS